MAPVKPPADPSATAFFIATARRLESGRVAGNRARGESLPRAPPSELWKCPAMEESAWLS